MEGAGGLVTNGVECCVTIHQSVSSGAIKVNLLMCTVRDRCVCVWLVCNSAFALGSNIEKG